MRTKSLRRTMLLVGALALTVVMLATSANAAVKRPPAQLVYGSGSDTTVEVMRDLDSLYDGSPGCNVIGVPQKFNNQCYPDTVDTLKGENYFHDVVSEYYQLGSSNGVLQLCSQGLAGYAKIDFARSSRTGRAGDCPGLQFIAFARDGISWVTFASSHTNGVNNLSVQQLKDIFVNCTITEWGQLNGDNTDHTAIEVYTPQDGSGTRAVWDGFMGGNTSNCLSSPSHKIFENNANPIITDGNQNVAIFPYSYGRYQESGGEGSDLHSVGGVQPTLQTIGNGSFPLGRFLYNVIRNTTSSLKASKATKAYLSPTKGWLCKPAASHNSTINPNYRDQIEQTIKDDGFAPLPLDLIGGGVTGQSHCRVTPYTP